MARQVTNQPFSYRVPHRLTFSDMIRRPVMTVPDSPNQTCIARVLVQTLSTSPEQASGAQIEDLRRLWAEGLASGDPQPVNGDWFASIGKRGAERLAKSRNAR